MKKVLLLVTVMIFVLAGCSQKPDSKTGSAYTDYFYESIEKAQPGYTDSIDKVAKSLNVDDELKTSKEKIEDTLDAALENVPDQAAEVIFDQYKKQVDEVVATIDFGKGQEAMDKAIEDSKTNVEQAKAEFKVATSEFTTKFIESFKEIIPGV
jgi:hypothetical protein